jgi:HPt (histidine-containing phosphotransfer) domain-containing protein
VPVVALTAHAGQEVRDRCLAEGFDDYLVKPLRGDTLQKALQRNLPRAPGSPRQAEPAPGEPSTEPAPGLARCRLDAAALVAKVQGDRGLLGELCTLFREDLESSRARLEAALSPWSPEEVSSVGHGLKGLGANVTAMELAEIGRSLQDAGRAGRIEEAGHLLDRLRAEQRWLTSELDRILASSGGAPSRNCQRSSREHPSRCAEPGDTGHPKTGLLSPSECPSRIRERSRPRPELSPWWERPGVIPPEKSRSPPTP